MNFLSKTLLLFIVLFAFFLRTYNLNWDSGTHIHPDERFLTMVVTDMKLPPSFADYLNPAVSSMNPHNINYGFFVYGTFPLYVAKILAILFKMNDYGNITILGRIVSAIFDSGIVIVLFFLSRKILNFKFSIFNEIQNSKSKNQNNLNIDPTAQQFNASHNLDPRFQTPDSFSSWAPLLPPLLYSLMVLPIQLSHFFAVDTFLVFFMITSFYISVLIREYIYAQDWRKVIILSALTGIATGLGLASKITMIFIIPLNFLVILFAFFKNFEIKFLFRNLKLKIRNYQKVIALFTSIIVIVAISTYVSFRLSMPMAFSDENLLNPTVNPKWIKNLIDLQNMNSPDFKNTFPPAIQWFTTQPIIYPLKNMVLWGMGIPMAALCLAAVIFSLKNVIPAKPVPGSDRGAGIQSYFSNLLSPISLLSFFTLAFFVYQGFQFAKTMRYFYPIYWCLALIAGIFAAKTFNFILFYFHETRNNASLHKIILIPLVSLIALTSLMIYPSAFLQIYTRPHTRVAASRWIYENIPKGSPVTFEEWDDPLPLLIDGHHSGEYPGIPLPMFWPDSTEKWNLITERISQADYIILSSNRVYGSVPRRADIYSKTIKFYEDLFAEKLNFKKIADFKSRPTVPVLNYEFIDDAADETFTVYDHPKVTIFRNCRDKQLCDPPSPQL